ncbi:hypothetical protein D5F01_LYC15671 [Larimichthys crocea]|uniref:Membrane-spanning 4-domains subfamily A member 15 n=1 Tax=Larimichthys crocea TaxID=215358 RepID=A0A6G0I3Y9_LARCR|nr:hypothetical protein D5F01_LYC15671 [Larimichthys crocea]
MEGTESTTRGRTTARDRNQEADQSVLMYSKPLHRFVQREPRILGIAIVIFGCAEFLMGFHLAGENVITSYKIYTPYWQGLLFIVCGSLSIYTGLHPSKKMVTVSLAMYIMSILGIVVSVGYRIFSFAHLSDLRYRTRWGDYSDWGFYRMEQLLVVEINRMASTGWHQIHVSQNRNTRTHLRKFSTNRLLFVLCNRQTMSLYLK